MLGNTQNENNAIHANSDPIWSLRVKPIDTSGVGWIDHSAGMGGVNTYFDSNPRLCLVLDDVGRNALVHHAKRALPNWPTDLDFVARNLPLVRNVHYKHTLHTLFQHSTREQHFKINQKLNSKTSSALFRSKFRTFHHVT